ncbi:AMP-dependent synthetase/ligase [Ideonella margarita]|uniref:AMP-binding protein n=1 Tax=Ideonella margarita TaxID=2984191 RepID=A0ABU9C3U6_9BURK
MFSPPAPFSEVHTLPELLAARISLTPDAEAYRQFDVSSGRWLSMTWSEVGQRVMRWRDGLAAQQLPRGARVAILLPNGIDAMTMDQATLALGGVPVPLHAIDNPASIAYILADCQASVLVVQQRSQWEAIAATGATLPALRAVVVVGNWQGPDAVAGLPTEGVPVVPLAMWLAVSMPSAHLSGPSGDDLAAIVYTSGTTGKPKGVMLTHANVVANVMQVMARVRPTPEDRFLSFLPLSHTFERTAGYYLPIASGSCVAYARSVAELSEDLLTQRPTVLISVPRIYERVHAKLQEALGTTGLKARLMALTQSIGWRRFRAAQDLPLEPGDAHRWYDRALWPVLQAVLARPVLARFGGQVRVAVSGGAPLPPAIARAFLGLGLPLLQGYGMTETSPVVAVNGLDDNDPACVGRALDGVRVRIGENRELQVAGPSVMKGYWARPEDTARVLSADGWMSTGDQAEIIDGRIYIRGRIKEIIVTSTGEKIPPVDLELAICSDGLFEQAFVVGENKPFIGAVVVLNRAEWQRMAASLDLNPLDETNLAHPKARQAALARMAAATTHFPRYAQPRAVVLSLEPWTIENTMMTPTLKLKRLNLQARFEAELSAMYGPR